MGPASKIATLKILPVDGAVMLTWIAPWEFFPIRRHPLYRLPQYPIQNHLNERVYCCGIIWYWKQICCRVFNNLVEIKYLPFLQVYLMLTLFHFSDFLLKALKFRKNGKHPIFSNSILSSLFSFSLL